jgi:hypothetical protein
VSKIRPESLLEPEAPYRLGGRYVVPVEIIPPDGENVWVMKDISKYYHLEDAAAGWYTADVRASLETFCRYKEGPTGEPYAELFSFWNRTYNPLSSNKIRFEITPEKTPVNSTIRVHVNLTGAAGGANIGESKIALENADVRLYRISKIKKDYQPVDRKLYSAIWNNVKPQKSTLTDSKGVAVFSGIEQEDYLLLARHPAFVSLHITGKLVAKGDAQWQTGKVVESYLSVNR